MLARSPQTTSSKYRASRIRHFQYRGFFFTSAKTVAVLHWQSDVLTLHINFIKAQKHEKMQKFHIQNPDPGGQK
jgi:hypothetical protein